MQKHVKKIIHPTEKLTESCSAKQLSAMQVKLAINIKIFYCSASRLNKQKLTDYSIHTRDVCSFTSNAIRQKQMDEDTFAIHWMAVGCKQAGGLFTSGGL